MDDFTSTTWYGLNGEFHQVLYEPSGRPFLIATITNLIQRSNPYIRMYFKSHDAVESQAAHRLILEAVKAKDERGLVTAVHDHLDRAMSNIVALLPS
jgi:DNA-binding GntR family transcriptional regulator